MPENNAPGTPPHQRIPPSGERNCPHAPAPAPAPSNQGEQDLPIDNNCRRRINFGWGNPSEEPNIKNLSI